MKIKSGFTLVAISLAVFCGKFAVADDSENLGVLPPAYLKHQSDFVQQVYSKVLIGFAFDRKCSFLEKSDQKVYENKLNVTSHVFQGYLLGNEFVSSANEALKYTKDMASGAIRYASVSSCDSVARDRVNSGFKTAQDFMSLIDGELEKGVQ